MEPKKTKRIHFRSLRTVFMWYVGIAVLLSYAGSAAIGFSTNSVQSEFEARYQLNPDYSDGESIRLYDADGNYYTTFILPGNPAERWKSDWNRAAYWVISYTQVLLIPLWTLFCLAALANLFYRRRIKKPIDLVMNGAEKIAANDLDFTVHYSSGDEMGLLCASFEKMRAALADSYRDLWRQIEDRRRINAAFSHDLRTPLTVLRGQTDLLSRYLPLGKLSQDKVEQAVTVMSAHVDRLERYVDGMAKLQRLEDVEPCRAAVSLDSLAPAFRAAAQSLRGDKLVRFSVSDGAGWLDPAIVQEVYENLLSNALRYAASAVAVSARIADGQLILTVADDGAGFLPEGLKRAADPFYRAPAQTDGGAHFGLGLNICKILCERHGGGLCLSNRETGGGQVTAVFAAAPPEKSARNPSETNSASPLFP